MANFLILHCGFEKPGPDEMAAWNAWFEQVAECQVERGGFRGGREITASGTEDLPFGSDSITGYTVIRAESLDEATQIAARCPIVASTRVYEVMG